MLQHIRFELLSVGGECLTAKVGVKVGIEALVEEAADLVDLVGAHEVEEALVVGLDVERAQLLLVDLGELVHALLVLELEMHNGGHAVQRVLLELARVVEKLAGAALIGRQVEAVVEAVLNLLGECGEHALLAAPHQLVRVQLDHLLHALVGYGDAHEQRRALRRLGHGGAGAVGGDRLVVVVVACAGAAAAAAGGAYVTARVVVVVVVVVVAGMFACRRGRGGGRLV